MYGGWMIWESNTTIKQQQINVIDGEEEYKAENH